MVDPTDGNTSSNVMYAPSPPNAKELLAGITADEQREFIDKLTAYYETHDLLKNFEKNQETGAAAVEVVITIIAMEMQGDNYWTPDPAIALAVEMGYLFGEYPHAEVICNAVAFGLFDFIEDTWGDVSVPGTSPLAWFNNRPETTKADVLALLSDYRASLPTTEESK